MQSAVEPSSISPLRLSFRRDEASQHHVLDARVVYLGADEYGYAATLQGEGASGLSSPWGLVFLTRSSAADFLSRALSEHEAHLEAEGVPAPLEEICDLSSEELARVLLLLRDARRP